MSDHSIMTPTEILLEDMEKRAEKAERERDTACDAIETLVEKGHALERERDEARRSYDEAEISNDEIEKENDKLEQEIDELEAALREIAEDCERTQFSHEAAMQYVAHKARAALSPQEPTGGPLRAMLGYWCLTCQGRNKAWAASNPHHRYKRCPSCAEPGASLWLPSPLDEPTTGGD